MSAPALGHFEAMGRLAREGAIAVAQGCAVADGQEPDPDWQPI